MKRILKYILSFMFLLANSNSLADIHELINIKPQENTQWCWVATTTPLITYYKGERTRQCEVAKWAFNGKDCCRGGGRSVSDPFDPLS